MRTWGVRVVLGLCLVLGSLVATSAPAGAVDDGRAAERAPALGWQGYDGARLGMSLRKAARRLDRPTRTDVCTPWRYVFAGPGARSVLVQVGIRRNGRVNSMSTAVSRVRGPHGVRVGMTTSRAVRRLERAGRTVRYRNEWNDAYGYLMRFVHARGPGGRVLVLRRDGGRVSQMLAVADQRQASWEMNAVGGC